MADRAVRTPAPAGRVATAKPSPTVPPAPTPQVYVVKAGTTWRKIAKKFGFTLDELLAANPSIKNPNKISLGQEIVIPLPRPARDRGRRPLAPSARAVGARPRRPAQAAR